jgi:hypothetical protein
VEDATKALLLAPLVQDARRTIGILGDPTRPAQHSVPLERRARATVDATIEALIDTIRVAANVTLRTSQPHRCSSTRAPAGNLASFVAFGYHDTLEPVFEFPLTQLRDHRTPV